VLIVTNRKIALIIISFVFFATEAYAFFPNPFDGRRRGFIVGVGIGPGMTNYRSDLFGQSHEISKGSLAFDFRIGYATTDRFQVYITTKMSLTHFGELGNAYDNWFDEIDKGSFKGVVYLFLTPFVAPFLPLSASHLDFGLGTSYYLRNGIPSWYFSAGFGGSAIPDSFVGKTTSLGLPFSRGGFGFHIGSGYEFNRHWSAELQILYGHADHRYLNRPTDWDAISLLLTVNLLGY
jgi:hypothetical protein